MLILMCEVMKGPNFLPSTHLWIAQCLHLAFIKNILSLTDFIYHNYHTKYSYKSKCVLSSVNLICCSVAKQCLSHYLLQFAQTHVLWVGDPTQLPHPLLPLSPPALNLSQHQGLFQWVTSSHQVVKILELQLQHLSFQ